MISWQSLIQFPKSQTNELVQIEKTIELVESNPVKGKTLIRSDSYKMSELEREQNKDEFELLMPKRFRKKAQTALKIPAGGDLGKSGPGPRAKADAARNARKTAGGSLFAQGFTPQRQYGSRPINKPLSCRNHAKLKNNPFDNNQDPKFENNAGNSSRQIKKDEVAKLLESGTKSYSEIKHELEIKQHKKTVEIDVAGKIYTIENADRMGVDQLENKLAEQMYNSIRDNHKDISDIAGNLGFKADNIKSVKDHVFYKEHVLDRYAHLGDDPVVQRFDPDLKQALAWKRFENGQHTPEDMEWLKHEYAERFIESTYDAGYTESHDRAQSRFDGNPWKGD